MTLSCFLEFRSFARFYAFARSGQGSGSGGGGVLGAVSWRVFSSVFIDFVFLFLWYFIFNSFFGVGVLCQRETRERQKEKQYRVCRRIFFFFFLHNFHVS